MSTVSTGLPAYDPSTSPEAAELKEKIQPIVQANLSNVKKDVYEELNKVDVGATITNLGSDLLSVQADFDEIYTVLGMLDEKNYRQKKPDGSPDGDLIPKFQSEWGLLRQKFKDLVWQSKEVATEGGKRAQLFRTVMVPILRDESISLDDKKKELQQFIEDIEASTEAAKKMSQEFLAIPVQVKDFNARVSQALSNVKVNFDKKIADLNQDIQTLMDKVTRYNGLSSFAWNSMWSGLGIEVAGIGILAAFGALLGPIGLGVVIAGAIVGLAGGIAALISESEINKTYEELATKRAELARLHADLEAFQKIEAQVKLALNRTENICGKLNAIGQVWAEIRTESQKIMVAMEAGEHAPTKYGFFAYMKDGEVATPYHKLEEVLFQYANHVVDLKPAA